MAVTEWLQRASSSERRACQASMPTCGVQRWQRFHELNLERFYGTYTLRKKSASWNDSTLVKGLGCRELDARQSARKSCSLCWTRLPEPQRRVLGAGVPSPAGVTRSWLVPRPVPGAFCWVGGGVFFFFFLFFFRLKVTQLFAGSRSEQKNAQGLVSCLDSQSRLASRELSAGTDGSRGCVPHCPHRCLPQQPPAQVGDKHTHAQRGGLRSQGRAVQTATCLASAFCKFGLEMPKREACSSERGLHLDRGFFGMCCLWVCELIASLPFRPCCSLNQKQAAQDARSQD